MSVSLSSSGKTTTPRQFDLGRSFEVGQDQHELVAAQPCHRVAGADRPAQALAHVHQDLIARLVAMGVVDGFETVEIEIADGDQLVAATGLGQRLGHAVAQQQAIGQAGEGVVLGHVFELGLAPFDVGEIGQHADMTGHVASGVEHRGQVQHDGDFVTVAGTAKYLAVKSATAIRQRIAAIFWLDRRRQQRKRLADDLVEAMAQQLGKGRIDIDEAALRIH